LRKRELLAHENGIITAFLNDDLQCANADTLKRYLATIGRHHFSKETLRAHEKALGAHIERATTKLEELTHKENIRLLNEQKRALQADIEQLARKKQNNEQTEDERKDDLKRDLELWNNNVYLIQELTSEQIAILKEEGYTQVNEYDILTNEIITALVKPPLNHSTTHAFLVWSVIRFLHTVIDEDTVQEHLTKDADITFKHEGKKYALEIETGNLLRKRKQLEEKVAYLNKKYRNQWMFIVSNKHLVAQYRKYGPSTQRKGVAKNMEKTLGIATHENRVEKENSRREEE
jgi:hypothetical protein